MPKNPLDFSAQISYNIIAAFPVRRVYLPDGALRKNKG